MRARKSVPKQRKKPKRANGSPKKRRRRPAARLVDHPCFSFNDSGLLTIIGNKELREKIYERVALRMPVRLYVDNPGVELEGASGTLVDDGGGGGNPQVNPDTMCPCDVDTNCPC